MAAAPTDAAASMQQLARPEGYFYESELPEDNDIVMIQVKRVEPTGAYVSLLEYNGREGFMPMIELSRRRIRSIGKLLRIGRTEIFCVIRVDQERGYIDLSKRRVDAEDARIKEEEFAKAKAVHGIMRHVAEKCGLDLEDFLSKFSWPLYKSKFNNPFDAYFKHINGDINVWEHVSFTEPGEDLTSKEAEIKEALEEDLKRKLLTQMLRMQAKVDVSCTEYEGIEAIKTALTAGLGASKEGVVVSIKLIAHPTFVLSCMCRDKLFATEILKDSMNRIKEAIEAAGGEYKEVQEPTVVGGDDQKEKKDDEEDDEEDSDEDSDEDSQTSHMKVDEELEAKMAALAAEQKD